MVKRNATIRNKMGIHVRPTGVIIQTVDGWEADIRVKAKGMETMLKDHMGLLAMGLCQGDNVEIMVSGKDEERIVEDVVELFEREYDFPPRR